MKQCYTASEYLPAKRTFVIQSKYCNCQKPLQVRTVYNPNLPCRRKNGGKEGNNGITGELGSQVCQDLSACFILANVLTVEIETHEIWRRQAGVM